MFKNIGLYKHIESQKHHHIHFPRQGDRTKLQKFIDKFIFVIAIVQPLMTIPQIIKIRISQDAGGMALLTWAFYAISASFWLIYGLLHQEKAIIISNMLWLIMQALVITGIILY